MSFEFPIATYRIQLRNGVDFAAITAQLDYFTALGISHLYLSPIFTAAPGSTHGYDVIDPTEIDPALGGRSGFETLAAAAHAHGIGIILDIVPNHTAFVLENPWLSDVLRKGLTSPYARHFDIDWEAGPLVLPILPEPFEKMLAEDRFSVEDEHWSFEGARVPLASGTAGDDLRAVHAAQHWRLRHWEIERDGITHRRFFNVTSLIGMRVEDKKVFNDTHALIVDLVAAGHVDGLRVDHIDGLADPKTYLDWLADAVPQTPVWIEKILVGTETLPTDWKTVGTTGYEAALLIARLLTDAEGLTRLDAIWRDHTGVDQTFAEALSRAKTDIVLNELAAELHQLVGLAQLACAQSPMAEPGPESLREAIIALLAAAPRYRTYFVGANGDQGDRALIETMCETAQQGLRSHTTLSAVCALFLAPTSSAAYAFVTRFQQVSGALLAKAQEDTAGFRWTRYLAANEVGAEPDEATVTDAEANAFLAERQSGDMTLTSTHDTKRSEDSRMRLVAISHHPEAFKALADRASALPGADAVAPQWRWYILQSALALWGAPGDDLGDRLEAHILKAMREAKQTTFWTRPDEAIEGAATAFAAALLANWQRSTPAELDPILETARMLVLGQLALKVLMPGFPDFYRGTEGEFLALTDPDNRHPVDPQDLASLGRGESFSDEKARLTRRLIVLRRNDPEFFSTADARVERQGSALVLTRSNAGRTLHMHLGPESEFRPSRTEWRSRSGDLTLTISWQD